MPPNNTLPIHGNEKTMNLNTMILTNIQASPYFKVQLYELKTYHQVIDEIYTRVGHLEPWEKGSRKTAGQTGMCGGNQATIVNNNVHPLDDLQEIFTSKWAALKGQVRGVGAGGIVSSCFCLLYKLYTLKLTRKQLMGLMTHTDSPYIRGIGFMYARFTQPPQDLWDWFEPYLDDDEEVDVKAGGGHVMTVGELVTHFLTKLEWYSTLFPRIPVPIQKMIEQNLLAYRHSRNKQQPVARPIPVDEEEEDGDDERIPLRESRELPYDPRDARDAYGRAEDIRRSPFRERRRSRSRSPLKSEPSGDRARSKDRSDRRRSRSNERHGRSRHRSKSAERHSHSHSRHSTSHQRSSDRERERRRSRSVEKHSKRERRRSRSGERERDRDRGRNGRRSRSHERSRHRSKSKEGHRHKSRDRTAHNDDYQSDLHKELERVKKSKSSDYENGN